MREIIVDTRVCADEEGRAHTFRYLLLIGEEPTERFSCRRCGVKIEEPGGESAQTAAQTLSRAQAMALLARFAQHGATPIDLEYLLEDLEIENRLPCSGRR